MPGGNWSGRKPDMECDLSKPLPLADGYADEIHAYHLFEHFWRFEAGDILKDWVRVLKPGGRLVMEMPCLDQILKIYQHYIEAGKVPEPRLTIWGLYGDPKYKDQAMCHKWCYSIGEIGSMLEAEGLKIGFYKPETHIALRDMRIEGIKCL